MKKGETFDFNKAVSREIDIKELMSLLKVDIAKFWSWGAENFRNYQNKALIFKVNGHHFKDAIVITLNSSDLFDVYYVNRQTEIVDMDTDIYFDDLVDRIDKRIEYISDYNS